MTEAKTRSFSQLSSYQQCPRRYQLERLEKAWQRPAAWLPMGTAVHYAGEMYERSGRTLSLEDTQDVFSDSYWAETNKLLDQTPNTDYWFASGPYRGLDDIHRRHGLGLEHTARYIAWYEKHPEQVIWITPDGTPAIELEFNIDLDGVRVRGFIDDVIQFPAIGDAKPEVRPRDVKTGRKPGEEIQISTYGEAARELDPDANITSGDFFMTRLESPPTAPYALIPREELVAEYHEIDAGIRAGNFPARPTVDKCRMCSVSSSCSAAKA
jgi:putative RecB family exonuclease